MCRSYTLSFIRAIITSVSVHCISAVSVWMQVKSVRIKSGKHTHNGCGIDGELFPLNGQVMSALLPEQCRLIGRSRMR